MKDMCIAAPAQIVKIDREANLLYADFGGARQEAKMDLLPDVEIGDYVLIHAGYAIEKLTEEAAKESLEAWEELLDILEEEDREMEEARRQAGLDQ
jgi:hydrogenase expression/formation protein HypC